MAKLVNLIPGRQIVKEELDDFDTNLPTNVKRFLDKVVSQLKSYSLPRKKEILVLATIIDALGMDKMELMRYVQKIKKSDILNK
jgi:phospholipid N-methyltransferase